ncbi:30S ribosomal protein S19 [Candidatus Woesearchaeota archaeon]|nr:30S ribosomal protein S19 [Candidatus Woesearchaeota archaeon]
MAKQLTWRGKTEEELKALDMKKFMELAPARQRRSLKRGFTDAQKKLLKRVERGDKNIKTQCRDMIIIPSLLGMMLRVYNGKEFFPITITPEMLGHYLGEFSHSRKVVTHGTAGVGATRSSKAISAR